MSCLFPSILWWHFDVHVQFCSDSSVYPHVHAADCRRPHRQNNPITAPSHYKGPHLLWSRAAPTGPIILNRKKRLKWETWELRQRYSFKTWLIHLRGTKRGMNVIKKHKMWFFFHKLCRNYQTTAMNTHIVLTDDVSRETHANIMSHVSFWSVV